MRFNALSCAAVFFISSIIPVNTNALWEKVHSPVPASTGGCVQALTMNSGSIYALQFNGFIFCSTDDGATWSNIDSASAVTMGYCMANYSYYMNNTMIVFNDTLYYGGSEAKLVMMPLSGTMVRRNLTADRPVCGFAVTENALYYAGHATVTGGVDEVFKSIDRGTTWNSANAGLPVTTYGATSIIKKDSLLFAGANLSNISYLKDGIYRSKDQGLTWTLVNTGLTNVNVVSMTVCGSRIFACTENGTFVTVDDGNSWSQVSRLYGNAGLHVSGKYIFGAYGMNATNGFEWLVSDDSGATWKEIDTSGLQSGAYFRGAVVNGNNVFVSNGSIFRTTLDQLFKSNRIIGNGSASPLFTRKNPISVAGKTLTISLERTCRYARMSIVDLNGRIVGKYEKTAFSGSWHIATKAIPAGMYTVTLHTSNTSGDNVISNRYILGN
jgi:photosystem II stability/assembly factor-like uncharacterized protein